jgi:hypothetical protein
MSRLRKRISILQPVRRLSGVRAHLAQARLQRKRFIRWPVSGNPQSASGGLKSRFVKSRPFIGRGQLLVFVDVSFGGKGKMRGLAKSEKRMSPWRCKKTTEIMSVACSLKAQAIQGAPRVAFARLSPWPKGRGLR